jgi:hypothetical protein
MHFTCFFILFGSFEVESAVCGSVLSSSAGKVNVIFACELLMEGRKKNNILIIDTILRKLWKL